LLEHHVHRALAGDSGGDALEVAMMVDASARRVAVDALSRRQRPQ
jgi:hypothetical protein